jgi:hypothetical protein
MYWGWGVGQTTEHVPSQCKTPGTNHQYLKKTKKKMVYWFLRLSLWDRLEVEKVHDSYVGCPGMAQTTNIWPRTPTPCPTHWLLDGTLLVPPFPWVSFKSTWERDARCLSWQTPPVPTMLPLYFPSLLFNKLPLHPRPAMDSSMWDKEFGSLLITDCTSAVKKGTWDSAA